MHRSKFRQLADGLAGVAQSMKLGAGLDTTAQINPLVSAHHRDKVVQHIEGARRAASRSSRAARRPTTCPATT